MARILFEETRLDRIEFGVKPQDRYYCLADRRVATETLDPETLRWVHPANLDRELRSLGCIAMMTGEEIEELRRRGELRSEPEFLHEDLYELCHREGLLDPVES